MDTEARPSQGWLVARYAPVALFSLKASFATSSVGISLVVPTPYAIKLALVDAAFRAGDPESGCEELLRRLVPVPVRVAPPEAVTTHTFCKVRQEPKRPTELQPYISNVAYREFVHHQGEWRWAFGVGAEPWLVERLLHLLPYIRYIGKRGSFVQFLGVERCEALDETFTTPMDPARSLLLPQRSHVVPLDDLGPEASLEVLSSFSSQKPKRDRHRVFRETIIPLGRARSGAGFTEYRR